MTVKIRKSPVHGRGMFSTRKLGRGTVLDRGYTVALDEVPGEQSEVVDRYAFDYDGKRRCIILGMASLCNHKLDANAEIEIDENRGTYRLISLREIKRGEEIFIDYGEDYWQNQSTK
jgi:hypothetical protein